MNKTTMLKWARRDKGLTQKQLAEQIGISDKTIGKLETHTSAWKSVAETTKMKLNEFFVDSKYWDSTIVENDDTNEEETNEIDNTVETNETKPIEVIHKIHKVQNNRLTTDDSKVLTLIEFAYEGLTESKNHDEFVANINMIKRILKKYNL